MINPNQQHLDPSDPTNIPVVHGSRDFAVTPAQHDFNLDAAFGDAFSYDACGGLSPSFFDVFFDESFDQFARALAPDEAGRKTLLKGHRCLLGALSVPQIGNFQLPDISTLQHCLDRYIEVFHIHFPFLHLPTLELTTAPSPLILGICAIGALYRLERRLAASLCFMAERVLASLEMGRLDHDPVLSPNWARPPASPAIDLVPLSIAQARLLVVFLLGFSGEPGLVRRALIGCGYISAASETKEPNSCPCADIAQDFRLRRSIVQPSRESRNAVDWKKWVARESMKRYMCTCIILGNLLNIAYGINPGFSALEECDVEIPDDDVLWDTTTATAWESLIKDKPSSPQVSLGKAASSFFSDSDHRETLTRVELSWSPFTISAVMHQVAIAVWYQTQGQQACNVVARDAQQCFQPEATRIETALSRCRKLLIRRSGGGKGKGWSDGDSPLLFNASTILRVSYGRAFMAVEDLDRSLLFKNSTQDMLGALQRYHSAPQKRGQLTTLAVNRALEGFAIPIRAGSLLMQKTAAFKWSVEHALAAWDAALLVTKWVHTVEQLQESGQGTAPEERQVLQNVRQLLSEIETEHARPHSLAAELARVWAGLYDDTWVWGGVYTDFSALKRGGNQQLISRQLHQQANLWFKPTANDGHGNKHKPPKGMPYWTVPWLEATEPHTLGFTFLALLAAAVVYMSLPERHGNLPYLNRPQKVDFFGHRARRNFATNARSLMADGRRLFRGAPYRLFTDLGALIVVPSQFVDGVRNEPNLSFMEFFIDNFHPDIPGFDGFKFDGRKDQLLHRTINKKLTKHLKWKQVPVMETMLDLVARISSRVFLGEELCRNPDWLAITKSYSINTTLVGDLLRQYPKWFRPIVCNFIPQCRELQKQVSNARKLFGPVLRKREEDKRAALARGEPEPQYHDTIQWLVEESQGSTYDPVGAQLGISVVATHTTTDLITETMLRLAERPELVNDLVKEIEGVLKEEGWTKTALFNMKLLDSVVKEAQRLKPLTSATMNRKATKRITLPGGLILEKGDRCMSDTGSMMDPSIYQNPDEYDGYRFFRMRSDPSTDSKAHLVSTSSIHLGFGHGKHACPGRFFAANEVKLLLCHLLYKYEWRVEPGYVHKITEFGLALFPDGEAQISIRKRQNQSIDIDSL
ncbi:hypothetical protein NM208_g6688 [Fusarium decemcellulare]|uniref:Uncharacterized protein n=1 Tax=Fusarium decemcellulare TaxID=57161 RepID=A0ACC1SC30_9HYPO|nr:hypothetical protein NM208_g6688 [Fusarium decemcellulare]